MPIQLKRSLLLALLIAAMPAKAAPSSPTTEAANTLRLIRVPPTVGYTVTRSDEFSLIGSVVVFGNTPPVRMIESSVSKIEVLSVGQGGMPSSVAVQYSKLAVTDEGGRPSPEIVGKRYVIAPGSKVREGNSLNNLAKRLRFDHRLSYWLATQTFVRDQPRSISPAELKTMFSDDRLKFNRGRFAVTWMGSRGSVATFGFEGSVQMDEQTGHIGLNFSGTVAADVETALVVGTELTVEVVVVGPVAKLTATAKLHSQVR